MVSFWSSQHRIRKRHREQSERSYQHSFVWTWKSEGKTSYQKNNGIHRTTRPTILSGGRCRVSQIALALGALGHKYFPDVALPELHLSSAWGSPSATQGEPSPNPNSRENPMTRFLVFHIWWNPGRRNHAAGSRRRCNTNRDDSLPHGATHLSKCIIIGKLES